MIFRLFLSPGQFPVTNRTLFVLVQLVWQLKTASLSDAQIWGLSRWKSDGFKLKLYIRSSKTWTNFQLGLFFRLLQSWAGNRLSQLNNQFSTIQGLSCQRTLTWGQWIFSHLLNPDWSTQISRLRAVCKVYPLPQNLQILDVGQLELFLICLNVKQAKRFNYKTLSAYGCPTKAVHVLSLARPKFLTRGVVGPVPLPDLYFDSFSYPVAIIGSRPRCQPPW